MVEDNSTDLFVIGPDALNLQKLEVIEAEYPVRLEPLLTMEEITSHEDFNVKAVLDKAERVLRNHPRPVGGVIGFWDFPVSLMVPILASRLGLYAPSLEAVVGCEHKYLGRILQREVAPEHVPDFQSLDPFDDKALDDIRVEYPFWIKPVKSFSSHLGFRVGNRNDLERAVSEIRSGIGEIGNAFSDFMDYVDLPESIRQVDGNHCVIEALIGGRQCTLEGFARNGEVNIYGIVDSFRFPNGSTFSRYQYPSTLPRRIRQQMIDIATRVINHIGLDHSAFNMEFFWDKARDKVWILEINPRISQSHGDVFEKVDGTPHHRIIMDLGLGRQPEWSRGKGEFACAAKVFLRRFEHGTATRVPTRAEIDEVERQFPGTIVNVLVTEGMELSELDPQDQDSYSYAYAILFVGASGGRRLRERIKAIGSMLPFEFR